MSALKSAGHNPGKMLVVHANSNAVGFDLSQGILNEGVAFYLVLDRDVVWFNWENAHEFAALSVLDNPR